MPEKRESAWARTLWLAAPSRDWPAIASGRKTEYRYPGTSNAQRQALGHYVPTPVFLYTPDREGMFVLERIWQEPLGAMSPESLAHEGFESPAEFRAYWKGRYRKVRFDRFKVCTVHQVRPWQDGDRERFEREIFDRLFVRTRASL